MRTTILALAVTVATGASTQTSAQTPPTEGERKLCIIQLASQLPRIPDITIAAIRSGELPTAFASLNSPSQPAFWAEIDFKAGALEGTYGTVCGLIGSDKNRDVKALNTMLVK
jgi:hypothetical protein